MSAEMIASEIKLRHRLTSLHIFDQDGQWLVFGFRKEQSGLAASVENGQGATIIDALRNLDARFIEGPIHK